MAGNMLNYFPSLIILNDLSEEGHTLYVIRSGKCFCIELNFINIIVTNILNWFCTVKVQRLRNIGSYPSNILF